MDIYKPVFILHDKEIYTPCKFEAMIDDVATYPLLNRSIKGVEIPVYYQDYPYEYLGVLYMCRVFLLCFEKNIGVAGVGDHNKDIEYVRFLYDENDKLKYIFLNAHSSDQGRYYTPEQLDIRDGNVTVYVAKGTHALYSTPGSHVRIFGFGTDYTSTVEKGKVCITQEEILIDEELQKKFDDAYVMAWRYTNPQCSSTFWYRFFYPLSKKFKDICSKR